MKLDYKPGDVFSLISKNNHEVAPIVVALQCTGIILNVLETVFTEQTFTDMFTKIEPKVVFCDFSSLEVVRAALTKGGIDARIFTFCGSTEGTTAVSELFVETGNEETFM